MTFEKRKWLEQTLPTNAGRITVDNKKPGPVAVAAVWVPYDKTVRVFYPYQPARTGRTDQPARTGKTDQPARIGETIFLENRALDFTTKPGNADGASQAEPTPLIVNIPRGADRSKCQDKQAQESGIWPDEHGLAADSAKQNQVIEELKGQIAKLQAERLVGGYDVQYWKRQHDNWKGNYDSMKGNYDSMSSNYNGMSNRYNDLCQMIRHARTSAYTSADKGVTARQWTLASGTSGYLRESDRQWAIRAILNSALTDVTFDSSGSWVCTYRSLP